MHEASEPAGKYTLADYLVLDGIICIAGGGWATEPSLVSLLPNSVRTVLDKWKAINVPDVPWVTETISFNFKFHYLNLISLFSSVGRRSN